MKKIKSLFKKNVKLVIGIIIGGVVFGTLGVYAATILYNANEIGYDNTRVAIEKTSGGNATNVQEAIESLYTKANSDSFWLTITFAPSTTFVTSVSAFSL